MVTRKTDLKNRLAETSVRIDQGNLLVVQLPLHRDVFISLAMLNCRLGPCKLCSSLWRKKRSEAENGQCGIMLSKLAMRWG